MEKQSYQPLASLIRSLLFDSIVLAVMHTKELKDQFTGFFWFCLSLSTSRRAFYFGFKLSWPASQTVDESFD